MLVRGAVDGVDGAVSHLQPLTAEQDHVDKVREKQVSASGRDSSWLKIRGQKLKLTLLHRFTPFSNLGWRLPPTMHHRKQTKISGYDKIPQAMISFLRRYAQLRNYGMLSDQVECAPVEMYSQLSLPRNIREVRTLRVKGLSVDFTHGQPWHMPPTQKAGAPRCHMATGLRISVSPTNGCTHDALPTSFLDVPFWNRLLFFTHLKKEAEALPTELATLI